MKKSHSTLFHANGAVMPGIALKVMLIYRLSLA
jgi:hypothetical protein